MRNKYIEKPHFPGKIYINIFIYINNETGRTNAVTLIRLNIGDSLLLCIQLNVRSVVLIKLMSEEVFFNFLRAAADLKNKTTCGYDANRAL